MSKVVKVYIKKSRKIKYFFFFFKSKALLFIWGQGQVGCGGQGRLQVAILRNDSLVDELGLQDTPAGAVPLFTQSLLGRSGELQSPAAWARDFTWTSSEPTTTTTTTATTTTATIIWSSVTRGRSLCCCGLKFCTSHRTPRASTSGPTG